MAEGVTALGSWTVDIAGRAVELPILPVSGRLAIVSFVTLDQPVSLGEHVGRELARRLAPLAPEVLVGAATLGIPVTIETARALGLERYVIVQKSPKFYLGDALVEEARSITGTASQGLKLDRRAVALLAGRRVAIVDDVVATGASAAALCRLVRRAGGEVVAIATVLTEANAWRAALGPDAALVVRLGHIPQFDVGGGAPVLVPASLDPG
jgi:adenine phosphoribosyltransferase